MAIGRKEISYSHLFVYPKECAHGFICFVVFIQRIHIALIWSTRIFQDWVPCNVELIPLSNYQLSMIWVNLIIRRQQLNKSTEHKISITCTIFRLYCIYMAYSQLMRYQLYEQNICVCIFIWTKMMVSFPFIKRVSILTARVIRITLIQNYTTLLISSEK